MSDLFEVRYVWTMHGGRYTNRVGVLATGPTPSSLFALSGSIGKVIETMLDIISADVNFIRGEATCLSNPLIPDAAINFTNVEGQRPSGAYTTHDMYKIRLRTATKLFRAGGKYVLGLCEGDVTDSAVDTDMPPLLALVAPTFAESWDADGDAYAHVLYKTLDEGVTYKVDPIVGGEYAHIGTASMRKRFRSGAYTTSGIVNKTLVSGDGKWSGLNQDPASGIVYTPILDRTDGAFPPAQTLLPNGDLENVY